MSRKNLLQRETFVLASTRLDVKSDKTFEEIVERLAALFKLKPRPGDQDYEEPIEINPPSAAAATSNVPQSPVCFPKNKK